MRYYYTDPLAAAWMAKHFGVKFCDRAGVDLKYRREYSCYYHPNEAEYEGQAWDDNFYVHSENESLFNLQKGDIVVMPASSINQVGIKHFDFVSHDPDEPYPHMLKMMKLGGRIISRNSIPFMWPEAEE